MACEETWSTASSSLLFALQMHAAFFVLPVPYILAYRIDIYVYIFSFVRPDVPNPFQYSNCRFFFFSSLVFSFSPILISNVINFNYRCSRCTGKTFNHQLYIANDEFIMGTLAGSSQRSSNTFYYWNTVRNNECMDSIVEDSFSIEEKIQRDRKFEANSNEMK